MANSAEDTRLTGRISGAPSDVVNEEVLAPQFRFEVANLLPHYVAIEKVTALEYRRMGLITADQATEIGRLLDEAGGALADADPSVNMSDIAFALEQHVRNGLAEPVAPWHVDRSRNDFQACAQLMYLRGGALDLAELMLDLWSAAHTLAGANRHHPMPGYTHFQAAQIVTPGFWLSALSEQVLHSARRLLFSCELADACPFGAGAMAGQELPWDREHVARLLGFGAVRTHALTAVASRRAVLEITAELSLFGAAISRFVTDLLMWGGSDCGFIDLPDELSGISSAMPQKKNFPVLERIRGKSGHLAAFHTDAVLGQRNTPFANLVEVSKEAGSHVHLALTGTRSLLRLLTLVLQRLTFRTDRMRAACEDEFFGGFTLANLLTVEHGVPWRQAQVLVGEFVTAALEKGMTPRRLDPEVLRETAAGHGVELADAGGLVRRAFDVDGVLTVKTSAGSVHPEEVGRMLATQREEADDLAAELCRRRERLSAASAEIDAALAEGTGGRPTTVSEHPPGPTAHHPGM